MRDYIKTFSEEDCNRCISRCLYSVHYCHMVSHNKDVSFWWLTQYTARPWIFTIAFIYYYLLILTFLWSSDLTLKHALVAFIQNWLANTFTLLISGLITFYLLKSFYVKCLCFDSDCHSHRLQPVQCMT